MVFTIKHMRKYSIEILGWYGAVVIVVSYFLVSFSLLTTTSFLYQFLNLTGALGIVFVSFNKRVYQPAVLNIIWAVIAFLAIVKLLV